MHLTKKSLLKWLKKECKKLPEETYTAYHKYYKPRYEMVEGECSLRGGVAEKHPVNHKRRAMGRWKRYGWRGVLEYFAKYGYKINQLS